MNTPDQVEHPNSDQMALDIHDGDLQQNGFTQQQQNHSGTRKGIIHRAIRHAEELYIFSLLYMQKSPLQPLIGPGETMAENHSFAHACYLVVWLFLPIAYFIINVPSIKAYVVRDVSLCNYVKDTSICEDVVVTLFINRFSLALWSFFALMASFLSISCKRSEYIRPSLQNGFWIPKLMLVFIVSLVTSSLPPGIFDTIWHYLLIANTIPQNVVALFLLLDLAKDVGNIIKQATETNRMRCLKDHALYHGSIAILLGVSLGIFIFCIVDSFRHRLLTQFDTAFLIIQCAVIIIVCIASAVRLRSFAQLGLVTAFVTWRTGLSLQYSISLDEQHNLFDLYVAVDSIFKLLLLIYGLFRTWKPWYYSFSGSVLCGNNFFSQSEQNSTSNSQSNLRTVKEVEKYKDIENEQEKTQPEAGQKERVDIGKEFSKQSFLSDLDSDEKYCELNKNKYQQVNEIGKRSIITEQDKKQDGQTFSTYNHHFVHVVLALSLLDLNLNFAKFHLITESGTRFQLRGNLLTSGILGLTSVVISVLYAWSKLICITNGRTEELSATKLLLNLIKSLKGLFIAVMIEAPPFARKPQQIKYLYAGILTLFIALACAAINPVVKSLLAEYSLFCDNHSQNGTCLSTDPSLVALFRFSVSATLTFVILSIVLIRARNVTGFRSNIQTGFWPTKILMSGLIFTMSLYLPIQVGNVWIYISLAATLLVIMLQTVFVLDATSQILTCLRVPESVNTSKRISFSCTSITVLLYTTAITAFFCFYVYFAQFSSCKANRLFIFINLGLCITACLISLHPVVQEGGLVQSAIITSFCMYCTWSALYNNPREECNPLAVEMLETDIKPTKSVLFALDIAAFFATFVYVTINISRIQTFLGRFTFVCCKFRHLRSESYRKTQQEVFASSQLSFHKVLLGRSLKRIDKSTDEEQGTENSAGETDKQNLNEKKIDEYSKQSDKDKQHETDKKQTSDTDEKIPYSYSLLHFIYGLLMLYFSLLLVTWIDERPGSRMKVSVHWAIMCVRIMASCCCVLVYMWNLVVHLIMHSVNQSLQ